MKIYAKLLVALCVLALSVSANAAGATKKKVKKTVTTTTTEEVDQNGKVIKKVETVEAVEPTDEPTPEAKPDVPGTFTGDPNLPSINESWYTQWGLGFGNAKFEGAAGDVYEDLADGTGADRSGTIYVEILGFYWPLEGHKTMLGFIAAGGGDSSKLANTKVIRMTYAMWSFSAQHYFGRNIGDGWFIRGDIGLGRASLELYDGTTLYKDTTSAKAGFLFGGGYAFPMSSETRLLLSLTHMPMPKMYFNNVTYNGSEVKSVDGSITSVNLSLLF